MNAFPQIIVGTYEEFILGYKIEYTKKKAQKFKFVQSFATHSHQASIRCIAVHDQLMASSGADEYINIYNMEEMVISSLIDYHDSTVTSLKFTPDGSFLVTANQNGDIAIFRCSDWSLVKLWKKAHSHALGVTCLNSHPTGSLLLSVGGDNILRFWNLIKGRLAYAVNFSKNCLAGDSLNLAFWSPTGKYYAISVGKILKLYETQTAAIVYEIKTNSKITCVTFTKKNILGIGTDEGIFEIHSLALKKLLLKKEISKCRLKCVLTFENYFLNKMGEQKIHNYLVIANSKGLIKLYRIKKKGLNLELEEKCQVDCDCRITCLEVVHPKIIKKESKEIDKKKETLVQRQKQKIKSLNSNEALKEEITNKIHKKKKKKLCNLVEKKVVNKNFQITKSEKIKSKMKKRKFI